MNQSGLTPRDEMVADSRFIEQVENENDLSYNDNFYRVVNQNDYDNKDNYVKIHPRLFGTHWASLKNHEINIQTLITEPFKYGDLFYDSDKDKWWLCMSCDCIDDVHYSGKLIECNYLLYWQNNDGSIVSRYCSVFNSSSYSTGEQKGEIISLRSNQFMIHLSFDEETNLLENGKRFHIAKSNRVCKAYRLSRVDDMTYGFDGLKENGVLNLIVTQDENLTDSDKLIEVKPNVETWICDYIEHTEDVVDSSIAVNKNKILKIDFTGKPEVKIGVDYKVFLGKIEDKFGNDISESGVWRIATTDEINEDLDYKISGNELKIKIKEDSLMVGGKIRATFSTVDRLYSTSVDIKIVNIF